MDSDSGSLDDRGHARPGTDHLAVVALTLLLGGSVIALVGQHTAAQAGPAIVLSLLLAALAAGLVLCCVRRVHRHLPGTAGLHGLLAAGWGGRGAGLLGAALLLELLVTLAGAAQSMAVHLQVALAHAGFDPGYGVPVQVIAAASLVLWGLCALMPPRRAVLAACALVTVKVGVGALLLVLAARHVHYAHWIPWLPEAIAPYRFGVGGVLAATLPLLGVFASAGLALGLPGLRRKTSGRHANALLAMVLVATLLLIALAALQAGLVEFPALASSRPLSVALHGHPSLQWLLPLLPLAGVAGLAALQVVLLLLAAPLATAIWPADGTGLRCDGHRRATVFLILGAMLLALWVPMGMLPALPGAVTLLVMAALCLAALRVEAVTPRVMPLLAPLAATLCLLAAVDRIRSWPM